MARSCRGGVIHRCADALRKRGAHAVGSFFRAQCIERANSSRGTQRTQPRRTLHGTRIKGAKCDPHRVVVCMVAPPGARAGAARCCGRSRKQAATAADIDNRAALGGHGAIVEFHKR